jgi:hypothetical protein
MDRILISQSYLLNEIKTLKNDIDNLTNINGMLTKSCKSKDQKMELLQEELEIYKSYFQNYMHFLKINHKYLFPKKYADFKTKRLFTYLIEKKDANKHILEDFDKNFDFSREKAIKYLTNLQKNVNKTLNNIFWRDYSPKIARESPLKNETNCHSQQNIRKNRSLSLSSDYISNHYLNEIKKLMERPNIENLQKLKQETREKIRKNSEVQANLTFISEWEAKNDRVEHNSPWREEISLIGNAKEASFMDRMSFFINLKKI